MGNDSKPHINRTPKIDINPLNIMGFNFTKRKGILKIHIELFYRIKLYSRQTGPPFKTGERLNTFTRKGGRGQVCGELSN